VLSGNSSSAVVNILKPERLIYPGQVFRIVANPVYAGKMIFNGQIIEATHEPIIDDFTYYKANEILEVRKMKNRTRPASYLLTGLLKCSKCGRSFNAQAQHYRYNDETAYGYRCRGAVVSECFNSISGKIDEIILEQLYNRILRLKLDIDKGFKKYSDNLKKFKKATPVDEVKSVETKMTRLMDSYLSKIIDLETYRKKNNELKLQLEMAKKDCRSTDSNNMIIKAYEYIKSIDIGQAFDNLEFSAKRGLVLMFINKITISPTSQGRHDYKKRIGIDWKTLV
jgi:site-specific DNA recombinase